MQTDGKLALFCTSF